MEMFSKVSNLLNNLDNVAKETLEEAKESATAIRSRRKGGDASTKLAPSSSSDGNISELEISKGVDASSSLTGNDVAVDPSSSSSAAEDSESQSEKTEKSDNKLSEEAKKRLRLQKKEIEKLNAECLELEETVTSLRNEVKDAWETYKISQERAAQRESELLEEIQLVNKAKATDKQQAQQHITKINEEMNESLKLLKISQNEKELLHTQLQVFQKENENWKVRESELLNELAQARAGSVIGAQDLLDSLANAEKHIHQIKAEHSSLLRQSQFRQLELEQNINDITNSLFEKDKELIRLQAVLQQAGRDEQSNRELETVRVANSNLIAQIDERNDKIIIQERKIKALECELRANLLSFQDERERSKDVVTSLENKLVASEEKLKEMNKKFTQHAKKSRIIGGNSEEDSTGGDWEVIAGDDSDALAKAVTQIQQLSTQLLKKQGLAQELQAEKAALKSRVLDLQNRCMLAEQQLNSMMDAEAADDYGDDDEDLTGMSSSSASSNRQSYGNRLVKRGGGGGKGKGDHKVINDLEKIGVKAGPSVAKAVNLIDSWTLVTGRFLRAYPLVRLIFALYFVILHIFVFIVLAVHVHTVEMETGPPIVSKRIPFVNSNTNMNTNFNSNRLLSSGVVS